MNHYAIYRAKGDAQQDAAKTTPVAHRRLMHLRSAEAWGAIAAPICAISARRLVNEAAKAAMKAKAG